MRLCIAFGYKLLIQNGYSEADFFLAFFLVVIVKIIIFISSITEILLHL